MTFGGSLVLREDGLTIQLWVEHLAAQFMAPCHRADFAGLRGEISQADTVKVETSESLVAKH